MKFLIIAAAMAALAVANPIYRVDVSVAGPASIIDTQNVVGPVEVDPYEPISIGPAIVDDYESISIGPAIVDEEDPIVGPAIVDEEDPIVGPAIVDEEDPIVGPAIVDEYEQISIGPAIVDEPIPDEPAVIESLEPTPSPIPPLVQIMVNVK